MAAHSRESHFLRHRRVPRSGFPRVVQVLVGGGVLDAEILDVTGGVGNKAHPGLELRLHGDERGLVFLAQSVENEGVDEDPQIERLAGRCLRMTSAIWRWISTLIDRADFTLPGRRSTGS
jgi:hypothetical protein